MKGVHLAVLLTICMHVFLVTGIEGPQCFHFTWPGTQIQDKNELNCTEFTPCIEPLYIKDTEPNTNEIWDEKVIKKNDFTYIKRMDRGNVCVKFTYIYNKAVVNVSYFSGKITEDRTPITSGCYVQYIDGYSIEVCACNSQDRTKPCNSTIRNTYSALIVSVVAAVTLLTYEIFNTP
ncbi:uncharacterized protein LOC105831706 isoform X1 [Monomorium pharaonis]|uniref:uncharacterized protein LOC105831706 isoform X1 n=1 Tax=Monomorium pharaonis TaxID=307658 RepID=UPI00063EFAC8|nr:uncharacterized protein LOC105831706 isoform X1 [Monomorium pharaonis]